MENEETLNRPIASVAIESVMKNFPKKSLGPDGFTSEFHNMVRELMPIFPQLFQKIKGEGTLPNAFYNTSVTLTPKPGKKLLSNIPDEHYKTQLCIKRISYHEQVTFITTHEHQSKWYHINRTKAKSHMNILVDMGKAFEKKTHLFMTKTSKIKNSLTWS